MAGEECPGIAIACYGCCLFGSGMSSGGCQRLVFVEVCGLVEQEGGFPQFCCQAWKIYSVAYMCIGKGWGRVCSKNVVWDNGSVWFHEIFPLLQGIHEPDGYIVEFCHSRIYVSWICLLFEKETDGRNPVAELDGAYGKGFGFHNQRIARFDYIEFDVEGCVTAKKVEDRFQVLFPFFERMDCNFTPSAAECKRSDKSGESEDVVAVEVCQENMLKAGEGEPLLHHGQLCPFSAINHHEVSAMVDYGGGRLMPQ